jgi:exopolysaccharide biosynthesis polyprenyl glycosylphosphotransferase
MGEAFVVLQGSRSQSVLSFVPVPRMAPPREAPAVRRAGRPAWVVRLVSVLLVSDLLTAALAGVAVLVLGPGTTDALALWSPLLLVVAWPAALALSDSYEPRVLGVGSEEYRRVAGAGLALLALAGFTSYAGDLHLPRPLVGIAVPALTAAALLVRFAARRVLHHLWALGRCTRKAVLVGRGGAVLELTDQLRRERFAGLQVVGACVTATDRGRVAATGLPVDGLEDVVALVEATGADTVAVTTASETAAEYLRRLSWQLEGTGVELLVAPGLVEVAGPRLHIRPLEGIPLVSVEHPRFEGWRRVVKSAVDRACAAALLLLLSPLLLAIAVAVRATSEGPALYRQERIGLGGRPFTILKFRSMVADADRALADLAEANVSDGLLFKIRQDPRVTPVGRWLRRYSLDELPQLLNVLSGSRSLVGPRPPLPGEVARYDSSVSRRLLVKPGLTGLWQISGRSDLPWEETVRLDLRYVDNWSLALDALILWKTGRAVLTGSGAY